MTLADNLKRLRAAAGLSQASLAAKIGVSQNTIAAIESGHTKKTKHLLELALALNVNAVDLDDSITDVMRAVGYDSAGNTYNLVWDKPKDKPARKESEPDHNFGHPEITSNDFRNGPHLPEIAKSNLPRDVPVLGISVGGDDADFTFNGNTIDYLRRPPGLAGKKSVYGLYVDNDSMWPRFAPGDPVYVDPNRKPANGEDAIIELHCAPGEIAGRGYIKRVVKRTPTKLIVEQFNPPKTIEFDLEEVKLLHRVIPLMELIGF